jgi:hypothetical protein
MSKESDFIKKLQSNDGPQVFMQDVLGVESLEEYQIEKMLKPIAKYNRVSIAATHSVGKTWTMARIALWFASCYKDSKVITTAPTGRQVRKLLWGELHSAYTKSKHPLGGKLLTTEWQIAPDWYVMGFSPQKEAGTESKEQSGSSFQGFHADYILIIFDEATGIPADIWKMAEGLLTSGKIVKFVAIANPTTRSSEFFKTFSDPTWFNVYLSCFDSPNLKANGIDNIHKLKRELQKLKEMETSERLEYIEAYLKPVPHLLSCQWVMSSALKWGIDHPLFQSKALGIFPSIDENVLVQLDDVEVAIAREIKHDPTDLVCIGVDVARYGGDDSVITTLKGAEQARKKVMSKRNVTEVAGEAINVIEQDRGLQTRVLIDATGIGAGVHDILKEKYKKDRFVEIIEIHFGQSPVMDTDKKEDANEEIKKRYVNLKARMFDLLSYDIKHELSLIDDSTYLEELPTIQFTFNSSGKMIIESKDDYKKRTGMSSPDSSDSLALANLGRHRKLTVGFFSGMMGGKTLNKKETSSDTMKRIEKRIKLNQY